jgi:FdhE protein
MTTRLDRMTKSLLRKLLGQSAPPAAVAEALEGLAALARQRPALADAVNFLHGALLALYAEPVREVLPALDRTEAATRLQAGLPLLRGETISLDEKAFCRRWLGVCAALRDSAPGADHTLLVEMARSGQLRPIELLGQVLAGRPEVVHARAEELGADPGRAAIVFRLTLFPVLAHLREALPASEAGAGWHQGYCYWCGGWPLLGEFRGLEQTRFLRCGLCAAAWEFPRGCCPFCDNEDHRSLGYYHVDGEEARGRAAACDACRGYVKMVTSLQALSGPRLLVTDLATTPLDLVMLERGYAAP